MKDRIAWIGVLFPIVGGVMLIAAIRATLRLLRFGRSTLRLESVPAAIGGVLRGSIEVPHSLNGVTSISLRLNCVTRVRSGKGYDEIVVCHEEREVDPTQVRAMTEGVAIPVEITVPEKAVPTGGEHSWQVAVDAELPGVDYTAAFEVPVCAAESATLRSHVMPAPVGPPRNPRTFFEREGPGGHQLVFPAFRALGIAFFALACALFAIAASAFTIEIGAPRIMTILFALVAIPILVSTIDLFFTSRVVTLGPDHVRIRTRRLFHSTTVIPYRDVESVRAVPATQQGTRTYYNVEIRTKPGKRMRVVRFVRSKREAEWIAARIART